jgi:hypothetical protein
MLDGGYGTKIILTVPANYNIYLNKQQRFAVVKDSILMWHGNRMRNALRVIVPFICACVTDSGFPGCTQACEESMSVRLAWICNEISRVFSGLRFAEGREFAVFPHIRYKHASILLLRERNVSHGGE